MALYPHQQGVHWEMYTEVHWPTMKPLNFFATQWMQLEQLEERVGKKGKEEREGKRGKERVGKRCRGEGEERQWGMTRVVKCESERSKRVGSERRIGKKWSDPQVNSRCLPQMYHPSPYQR